jgi:hypothetical protein
LRQNFAVGVMSAPQPMHLELTGSSACEGVVMNPPNEIHANLLVVFLLVTLYISERGKSRPVLPRLGFESAGASQEARLFSGRHAELWLLYPPLAAG